VLLRATRRRSRAAPRPLRRRGPPATTTFHEQFPPRGHEVSTWGRHLNIDGDCKNNLFYPQTCLLLKATIKTVTMIPRNPVGCLMKSAHHIFFMYRVLLEHFSTRPSPVTYMYVVSAKITWLPLKLSSSHSYYQHGHCGTLETRGVFDEERSSYFLHVPSASGAPFNTCNPPQLYVRCECKNNLFSLKVVSFSKLLSTRSR
jgi:hypothetical protein